MPLWFVISQAVFSVLLASAVAWITYQQLSVNRLKLKLELFERRIVIFEAVKAFLGKILATGKTSSDDCIQLLRDTNQAEYLFGSEVSAYIMTLYTKGIELEYLNKKLSGVDAIPIGPERCKLAEQDADALKWFSQQYEVMKATFRKYLMFDRL